MSNSEISRSQKGLADDAGQGPINEPDGHSPFPIVGLGASAGGLEAFQQLLAHVPPDVHMAFILVQHLDATHQSHLTDILARATRLPVLEASHGHAVLPGRIYVIAPNTCLAIAEGLLRVTPRDQSPGPHLPVDHLFRSLAIDQQGRAIGVVLSGTGADGTMGLCEIKAAGGITFAQNEASARHPGMPHSAIESGSVDFVMTPEAIARQLVEIAEHPYLDPLQRPEPIAAFDEQYKVILAALRAVASVNFSHYRETTIKRRIMRRMALHNQQSMADYALRLAQDPSEVEALYRDLLINVTSFFRDAEVFEYLKREVFPQIINGRREVPVRFWVPGCSTGQEAYSLAIILWEFFDDRPVRPPIQVFASDMSNTGLSEKARAGLFPASIEAEVEPGRLQRFFKKEDHLYRIDKVIRDACIFAPHNVMVDPPFSRVDLISCRNLLIYLDPSAQKQVLSTFHYALNVPGFLVLGTAENVSGSADQFALLDRDHKVYKKNSVISHPPMFPLASDDKPLAATTHGTVHQTGLSTDYQVRADRLLLADYAPPGVLVDEDFDILQFRGETRRFLSQPAGQPTVNLLRLAREGLFLELRSALDEARNSYGPVRRENVRLPDDQGAGDITLRVLPIESGSNRRCFLVLFEAVPNLRERPVASSRPPGQWLMRLRRLVAADEHDPANTTGRSSAATPSSRVNGDREIERLQRELTATKEYLQSIIEQQDALAEELRSANEETQSANEELHSTNEELQTAKEELQSSNQELTTLNEQLRYRNLELTNISDDLNNLITSTTIPVLMVSSDLRVRRITAPARRVMNLPGDYIGRPLRELATNFDLPELEQLITEVIEQVQPREIEARDRKGSWYLLRIHPYRTTENKIDGAVLVLLDINDIKMIQQAHQEVEERLHLALEGGSLGTWYCDFTTGELSWDDATNAILGLPSYAERNEVTFFDRVHPDDRDKLRIVRNAAEISDRYAEEIRIVQSTGSVRWMLVQAKVFSSESGAPSRLTGISMDITERRELAEKLRVNMDELERADQKKNEFIAILSHELRNPLAPIVNAVAVLRAKDVSEAERDWSREVIDRQVQQMTRLLDDLLDVGRITHDKLILRKEQIILSAIIDSAIEISKPLIDERRQQLTVNLSQERIILEADHRRLSQVLSNLLNNAAKYTPKNGHISLTARREDNNVVVSVKDTGIGIRPELLPHVFDIFVQAASQESERAGLGLGLTLVRSLVELHGGNVEARSDGLGHGSEFLVRIPIAAIDPENDNQDRKLRPTAQSTSEKRLRILVVDDLLPQAKTLALLLQMRGHEVRIGHDGPTALRTLEEFPADVALIDIGLPGMDGYSLARRIREQPQFRTMVLVAQTGWAHDEDRLRSKQAGFDYHLAKPLDHDRLHDILTESDPRHTDS